MWGIDPKAERGLQDQDAKTRQAELDRQQGHIGAAAALGPSASKAQPPVKSAFTTEPLNNKAMAVKEKNPTDRKPALLKTPKAPPDGIGSTSHAVSSAHVKPAPSPTTAPATTTSTTASSPLPPDTPATVPTSSSSSMPQIPSNVSLPIVVAPLPESHPASASAAALVSSTSPASAILTTPPIVLHAGTLILNPVIFSHLTAERLKELEGLGAQKALEILQGHIVRFLKEKMRSEGGARGRGRGRGRGGRVVNKGSRKEVTSSPADTKPITKQEGQESALYKPSLQPSSCHLANEQRQTNGVDSASEERVKKKQKMDKDVLDVDVDVDVIGP